MNQDAHEAFPADDGVSPAGGIANHLDRAELAG
jgi:hypothetical protein